MTSNILIVDDEPSVLKLLKDILTLEGHRVRPFSNGELALRSAEAEIPDLILLDIRMPGMDGFEICRRLKENRRLTEIPVIFISAATDMEDKIRAFQVGGVDYITKPIQREEVIARVKNHVMLNQSLQEMKRIANALYKSETNLRIAQAMANLSYWEWDAASGQFHWSEEAELVFGLDPQKLPTDYKSFLQSVHPDDRERVADALQQILAGQGCDIEYRIVLPDGSERVVHGKGQVVGLSDNHPSRVLGIVQSFPPKNQVTTLGIIQDITERKRLESELEKQANTDFLTGCSSRRHFMEHMEQEISRIHRYGGELSVLELDLDHFKNINDQYGHLTGDLTLKQLVKVCRELLREVDLIGRLGGEEFGILLPETDNTQAFEVAQRLCHAIAAAEVPLPSPLAPLRFTASIGVASLMKSDTHIEAFLNRADKALYQAKHQGRNRVCV